MIARILLLTAPVLLIATGCMGSPSARVAIDQMTAELTAVEDRYYELEYKYQLAKQELEACRGKNGNSSGQQCVTPGEIVDTSVIEFSPEESSSTIDLEFPEIEMEAPENFQLQSASVDLGPITHIMLEPTGTGGIDLDADDIDDAILLSVLPRDANGNLIDQPGEMMISLIDPKRSGESQRVGLWKLGLEEVATHLAGSSATPGINFELPWQTESPQNNHLKLYVRFITDQGERFETSMDINVNIPGSIVRTTPLPILMASAESTLPTPTIVSPEAKLEDDTADAIEWKPTRD